MTPTTRPRNAGFTLIEMLVVIMILGVVTTLGTTAFVTITRVWDESRAIGELDNQAQAALESIRADLQSAVSYDVSGVAIAGATRTVKDSRTYPQGIFADDDLCVAVEAADVGRGNTSLAKVGYRVDRQGSTGKLIRTTGPMRGDFPEGGRIEVIPAKVQGFSVEYLGREAGAVWGETWAGPGLPGAIRVSIALEDPVRPEFEVARKMVVSIHVQ